MNDLTETYLLDNGVEIPKIGFGTWLIKNEDAAKAVEDAIKVGYRHIDSAEGYGNEEGVGQGVRASSLAREDIFITTKLRAEIKDYDQAVAAIEESLQKLDLGYIDLMIIHAPKPWPEMGNPDADRYYEGNLSAWRALEEAYEAGKIRAIGVSNFDQDDLKNILDHGKIKPVINQVKAHIGQTPLDLIDYAREHDILTEAYSPLGHGDMLHDAHIQKMADKYGVSIAQLGMRYLLQLGTLPLPKSMNPEHMAANAQLDFEIAPEDMAILKDPAKIEAY
jgi:diketogulonate reductase-like aldo/keto reductase